MNRILLMLIFSVSILSAELEEYTFLSVGSNSIGFGVANHKYTTEFNIDKNKNVFATINKHLVYDTNFRPYIGAKLLVDKDVGIYPKVGFLYYLSDTVDLDASYSDAFYIGVRWFY